jgi:hypothetical protein
MESVAVAGVVVVGAVVAGHVDEGRGQYARKYEDQLETNMGT